MKFRSIGCVLAAVLAGVLNGGELTLEERPFDVVRTFDARVFPTGGCTHLEIVPRFWKEFRLERLAAHGEKVAKDEVLAAFETEGIDEWLEDQRAKIESGQLALAAAGRELKRLEETAEARLAGVERAAAVAKEENESFTKTRRKAAEEAADQALKHAEWALANETEELVQLQKMYEADDLTEETEEIILTRQKDAVQDAEFDLRMGRLNHRRTREVLLPRKAADLAEAERKTAVEAAKQRQEVPAGIEAMKLEVAAMRRGLERDRGQLEEAESDRALFEFKAPADGWFYHGELRNGRWITGDLLKTLMAHGEPVLRRPVATFVPAVAEKKLVAWVDQKAAGSLAKEARGVALFPGREDGVVEATIDSVAEIPEVDGKWRVEMSVSWPEGFEAAVGSQAEVRVVAYQRDPALAVPNEALRFGADGWTVEVKLADGKTQRRVVARGRVNDVDTEILDGLEAGQVILVP